MINLLTSLGTVWVALGIVCAPSATVGTVVGYLLMDRLGQPREAPLWAAGVGLLLAFAASAVILILYRRVDESKEAYPSQYQELSDRLAQARSQLQKAKDRPFRRLMQLVLGPGPAEPSAPERPVAPAVAAQRAALEVSEQLRQELEERGPHWIAGAGYLDAWSRLHRIEELLILCQTSDLVIAGAREDLLKLSGSDIAQRAALIEEINRALPLVSRSASGHLSAPPCPPPRPDPAVGRAELRNVRAAINQDREGKWLTLLRGRNLLMISAGLAGFMAYLLLLIPVLRGTPPRVIATAMTFALVGVVVGLAHQLTLDSPATGIEDFGLAGARVLSTALLSAITAVLGVALMATLEVSIGGGKLGGHFVSWQATFDWSRNRDGYLIALIFGFAPSLLFSVINDRTNGIKSSLKASEPAGQRV